MKSILKIPILASVFSAHLAVATWGDARSFSCPSNTDNQCSDGQKSGYDWKQAQVGPIANYDQVSLSGFACADSFSPGVPGRKRSVQVRSDFNQRCIRGKASKQPQNPPKISCNQEKKMSITSLQVSVAVETELEFHFDMPDGSVCKKSQKCSSSGTVVTNDQCGGAKSVWVQVSQNEKQDCEFGIHQINFDCNPPEGGSPPKTTTAPPKTTEQTTTVPPKTTDKTMEKTTDKTTEKTTDKTTEKTTEKTTDKTTDRTTDKTSDKSTDKTTMTMMTTAKTTDKTIDKTSEQTKTKTTEETTKPTTTTMMMMQPPTNTTSSATKECSECDKKSSTTVEKLPPSSTPVTTTMTSMSMPPMTTETTTLKTSTAVLPPVESPPADVPCPSVLPRCLNTWMARVPNCKSNSDISCICPQVDYIAKVQDCVTAWGGNDGELQGAYSYLAGICAKYVPQNPGICTNVPSTITLVPNPTPPPQVVVSTMGSMVQTITVPMTASMTPPPPEQCTTITWTAADQSGVMTTGVVTVPQVVFTTGDVSTYTTVDSNGQPMVTTSGDQSVGLVPYVPATTTPAMATPFQTGPLNMTAYQPTRTGDVSQFTGAAVALDAKLGAAGLLAVIAFLL